jgi:aminopeptidase N
MYQTLLGREGFRQGMDLYFKRHDGQAVTCDDFRAAMADSSGRNLVQFERWYSQSGTPSVQVTSQYDAAKQTYELTLSQTCKPGAGLECKLPFHIPVAVGLLDAQGADMPLHLEGAPFSTTVATTCVLELTKEKQTFRFNQVTRKPTPSLLRNFSAPVDLVYSYSDEELAHLMAHDSDAFNRWEAGQRLATNRLLKIIDDLQNNRKPSLDALFINTLRTTLTDETLDPAFRELALTLPSESMLAEQCEVIDPQAIHAARKFVFTTLAENLKAELITEYTANQTPGKYSADAKSAGKRGLKNLCLAYLLDWADDSTQALALAQVNSANNMTDRLRAIMCLVYADSPLSVEPLKRFYTEFSNEELVVDKWFSLQAVAATTDVQAVRKLMKHPAFTLKNPNRARSLIFSFCNGNPAQFHALDGSGYAYWLEQVIALNKLNPQVAARLVRTLDHWKKYTPVLKKKMQAALQQVAAAKGLSKDVQELVSKALT